MNDHSKIIRLFKSGLDEIVFHSRNKAFGAYQLRILSRMGMAIGFTITLLISGISFSLFSFVKARKPKTDKYVEYEVFNPSLKTTPILKEPPKGDPNAQPNKDEKKTDKPKTTKTQQKKDPKELQLDPTKIEKDALEQQAAKDKAKQDSLAKAQADSIALKNRLDSLAAAQNKFGTKDGKGVDMDTTHHKPIGGPSEFGEWLAMELKPKYTAELKAYGRSVTFTVGFDINHDSTISNIKLYQKAYFGMDEIILETVRNCKKKFTPAINPQTNQVIKSQPMKAPVKLTPYVSPKSSPF